MKRNRLIAQAILVLGFYAVGAVAYVLGANRGWPAEWTLAWRGWWLMLMLTLGWFIWRSAPAAHRDQQTWWQRLVLVVSLVAVALIGSSSWQSFPTLAPRIPLQGFILLALALPSLWWMTFLKRFRHAHPTGDQKLSRREWIGIMALGVGSWLGFRVIQRSSMSETLQEVAILGLILSVLTVALLMWASGRNALENQS